MAPPITAFIHASEIIMADPFGRWLVVPGTIDAHYFLPGEFRCLCRSHHRPVTEQAATRNPHLYPGADPPPVRPYCPDCHAINNARWLDPYGRLPEASKQTA